MAIGAGFFVPLVLQDWLVHGRLFVRPVAWAALMVPAVPFLLYTVRKRIARVASRQGQKPKAEGQTRSQHSR
jgi:hypothetical protein